MQIMAEALGLMLPGTALMPSTAPELKEASYQAGKQLMDLIAQLKDQELGEELLLPCNMLRSGEDVFLDDLTVADVEKALQTKLRIVESDGCDFVRAVSGR